MIVTSNYRHLNLYLTRRYITMHMYPCETKWLEKALQDNINTQTIVVRPTLHPCNGQWCELMPILVICDGVHALNGDIFLKRTLAFVAFEYTDMAPPSNLSDSMCIVVMGATGPATCSCIVSVLISKHVLVVVHINLSKYMLNSILTCFLSLHR